MATNKLHHHKLGYKILTCFLILVFDIAAGVLCIQAQVAQSKVGHLKVWIFECRNPSHEAFKLVAAAAMLLCLAHSLSNSLPGCVHKSSSCNTQLMVLSLVAEWILVALALLSLIMGVWGDWGSRKICGIPRQHYLTTGGIMCFAHALFSLSYYYMTANSRTATPKEAEKNNNNNNKAPRQVISIV
ncbi:hypothetical protein DM860_002997 [Cuscuta australis]|uniref:Uncharacterized protein n=1 Tax=Cuscuta australis TaxID=267555 RepID=A0A328D208_9ASTE|nr:hypothetical protein DM860_002997 [Cuscuta australis]